MTVRVPLVQKSQNIGVWTTDCSATSHRSDSCVSSAMKKASSQVPIFVFIALLGAVALAAVPTRGKSGGTLVVAQTSEPKTLNPVTATDQPTRDVLSVMSADLVHINRKTLRPELALARSYEA